MVDTKKVPGLPGDPRNSMSIKHSSRLENLPPQTPQRLDAAASQQMIRALPGEGSRGGGFHGTPKGQLELRLSKFLTQDRFSGPMSRLLPEPNDHQTLASTTAETTSKKKYNNRKSKEKVVLICIVVGRDDILGCFWGRGL